MTVSYKSKEISIELLIQRLASQELILQPDYQRFYIWKEKKEQLFIDSIMRKYPVPPIWIWQHEDKDGNQIWEIIDGQQRLTCIKKYFANKFSFTPKRDEYLPDELKSVNVAWHSQPPKGTNEPVLPVVLRNRFKSYDIPYVLVETAERDLIIDIFRRLNQSSTNLTPQELRNAFFRGKFKTFVYELTDKLQKNGYWGNKDRVFTKPATDRMAAQQFISVLIVALCENQVQNKNEKLDQYYAQYDTLFSNEAFINRRFQRVLQTVKSVLPGPSRFTKNLSDFYSVFLVLDELDQLDGVNIKSKINIDRIRKVLMEFQIDYDKFAAKRGEDFSHNEIFEEYRETIVGRQREKEIRKARNRILRGMLLPELQRYKKDRIRLFTEEQKRYMWFNSGKHTCALCQQTVTSYDGYQLDHIVPWAKGGETSIFNAQITHEICNQSKGDKKATM